MSDFQDLLREKILAGLNQNRRRISVSFDAALLTSQHRANALTKELDTRAESAWIPIPVARGFWKRLPKDQGGLYAFVWTPAFSLAGEEGTQGVTINLPVYVGKTTESFYSRVNGEYRRYMTSEPDRLWGEFPSARRERLSFLFSLRQLTFWYRAIPPGPHLGALEDKLIEAFNPPGNAKGRPRGKLGKSQPAF